MVNVDIYLNANTCVQSLKNQAIKGAGVIVAARISTYCIQMIGTVILARMLVPEDFGLVTMVTVFIGILIEFGILGLSEATIQKEYISHDQVSTLFWINVILCVFVTIFFIIISPLLASYYSDSRIRDIAFVFSSSFIFTGLSVQHMALLRRRMEFYKSSLIDIISSIVSTCTAIVLAYNGYSYWAVVWRQISVNMVTSICAWFFCKWRPGPPSRNANIRPMIQYGIFSIGSYFINYMIRNADKFLIGMNYSPSMLGAYDRAYHLFVMPVNQLSYPLTSVAVPTLSKLYKYPELYRDYYLKAIKMLSFLGMGISTFVTISAKDIVMIVLGPKWIESGQILSAFGPSIGVMIICGTHGWLHLSLATTNRWFRWSVFSLIVTFIIFLVCLRFGPFGIASGYSISLFLIAIPGILYAGKPVNLSIISVLSNLWKFCLSALISGLLSWIIIYKSHVVNLFIFDNCVILRLIIMFILTITLYLLSVIILHKSFQPIIEFICLLRSTLLRNKEIKND